MLANREGLFNSYPMDIGLGQTRQAKLLQVNILYRLVEELQGEQWLNISGEALEITGYHVLEKKDGSLNTVTIESLKAALGWDGRDPFWLQDNAAELAKHPVQVKLAFEEYNGQQNLKVQFLNPYGSQRGGVAKADDDTRRAVNNRLGSKFRALAGGTPANPPLPAGKPAAPAAAPKAPSKPAPAPAPVAPATSTMDEAWAAFCQEYDKRGADKGSDDDRQQQWFDAISALFPGKQADQLTASDWAIVKEQGPGTILPF